MNEHGYTDFSIVNEKIQLNSFSDGRWGGLDDAFLKYNASKYESKLCNILSANISFNMKKEFSISIVNKDMAEPFFGARVFPSQEWIDKVSEKIIVDGIDFASVSKMWSNIDSWVIELDYQLFDRYSLSLNPKEKTAIILHEIGHVVQSSEIPERFYRVFTGYKYAKKLTSDAPMKALYTIYMLPLAICCMGSSVYKRNADAIEIFADRFVVECGYGEDLLNAISKIIRVHGYSMLAQSEDELDKRVYDQINWGSLNVSSFSYRKSNLKDELYVRTRKNNSPFIRKLGEKILKTLGIKLKERYSGSSYSITTETFNIPNNEFPNYVLIQDATEAMKISNMINLYRQKEISIANEAHLRGKTPKLPSQFDIDSISIELDRMQNQHDRMYVLDLIYYQLTQLEQFENYMETDKDFKNKYKSRIDSMRKTLEEYRMAVLNKHNFNQAYKLWVKYPEGYEG